MKPLQNLRAAWPGILQSMAIATLAWLLARWLLGHERPSFAAIAVIVCLSPGLASRGRQAVGMIVGVATGVAVGECAKHFGGDPVWSLALSASLAMFAAVFFSVTPVLIIQAGTSAVLVVATGTDAGYARLEDPQHLASSSCAQAYPHSRSLTEARALYGELPLVRGDDGMRDCQANA